MKRAKVEEILDAELHVVEGPIPEPSNTDEEKVDGDTVKHDYSKDEDIPVKREYILPNTSDDTEEEQKMSKRNERKQKVKRTIFEKKLCHFIGSGDKCPYGDTCKNIHNVEEFLSTQLPPLDGECTFFKQRGKCPYGPACRFRTSHMDGLNSIVDEAKFEEWSKSGHKPTMNVLGKDFQIKLRKRQITFTETGRVLAEIKKKSKDKGHIIIPKEKKSKVDFEGKLILAPLTTIGNLPFRRICKTFGADITIGEMAMNTFLLQGKPSELALIQRHESEDVFGVQIAGNFSDTTSRTVELLNKYANVDFIDLNVGCPIDLMYKQGVGCGLLKRISRLEEVVRAMTLTSEIPITVKVRVGTDWKNPVVHSQIAPFVKDWGIDALTIHGRTRTQRYRALADWSYVEKSADVCGVPVIGNGDIYSWEDAEQRLESGKISGLMLARGAIIKPWLFKEIKEKKHWDISSSERFDILKNFVNFGLEHWGSDQQGVEKTRYFLLNWMSFLHRYVPVGLIERLPVRLNQRPPKYIGRDDLETWMASPKIEDWVRLSTMLLGPVPEDFDFQPKHQAKG